MELEKHQENNYIKYHTVLEKKCCQGISLKKNLIITLHLNIRTVVNHHQFSSANAYRTLMTKEMELKERKNDCLQLQILHDLENGRSQRIQIYDAT